MSDLFTRSRTVILRNWRELSPKLAVGLLTGSVTGAALDFAASNHITIAPTAQHFIVIGGFFLGGYIKSETFPTIQNIERDLPKAEAVAEHVIHPPLSSDASPATSPVKIVPVSPGVFTKVITDDNAAQNVAPASPDQKPTEVIPSASAPFMGSRFGA